MNCSYFKFSDLFKTELISSTEIQNHLCFLTLFIATNITWIFPGGSEGKESACNVGDLVQSLGRKSPWRRKWQPTPVFLPGESHGRRRLAGYSP